MGAPTSIGALSAAISPKPRTLRVSAGRMTWQRRHHPHE